METKSDVLITSDGEISVDTFSSGKAGSIKIIAHGRLTIEVDFSAIDADTSGTRTTVTGKAGNIYVHSDSDMEILKGGLISSTTGGSEGNAGSITVESGGKLTINAQGSREKLGTGIVTVSQIFGNPTSGDAGRIRVDAKDAVILRNGAEISSSTDSNGKAGSVDVKAAKLIVDGADSVITAESLGKSSSGKTGDVAITATKGIDISNSGRISLENGAIVRNPRNIPAGHMNVTAPKILLSNGGAITSESKGNVDAGNIQMQANTLLMDSGVIQASANSGRGGNVKLDLQNFFPMGNTLNRQLFSGNDSIVQGSRVEHPVHGDNVIQAVSAAGLDGKIILDTP